MKKRRPVILVLLLVVLAVLIAALVLLTGGKENEIADPSVLRVSADTISAMEWTNAGEEVRLVKKNGKWHWAGDDRFPVDQLKAEELSNVFTSLTSTAYIAADELGDLKDYGLHFPLRTLAAEDENGSRITYEIGSQSPLNSSYFYVRVNGSDVYLVERPIYDAFEHGLYDVIQTEEIPAFVNISSVKFETDGSYAVYTRDDSGEGWLKSVNGGEAVETDTSSTNALVKQITGLEWAYCVHFAPDETERAEYGTDTPSCTVTVKHEGEDFVLELCKNAGEYTYAKLKGSDMVYLIDGTVADAFMGASK